MLSPRLLKKRSIFSLRSELFKLSFSNLNASLLLNFKYCCFGNSLNLSDNSQTMNDTSSRNLPYRYMSRANENGFFTFLSNNTECRLVSSRPMAILLLLLQYERQIRVGPFEARQNDALVEHAMQRQDTHQESIHGGTCAAGLSQGTPPPSGAS